MNAFTSTVQPSRSSSKTAECSRGLLEGGDAGKSEQALGSTLLGRNPQNVWRSLPVVSVIPERQVNTRGRLGESAILIRKSQFEMEGQHLE